MDKGADSTSQADAAGYETPPEETESPGSNQVESKDIDIDSEQKEVIEVPMKDDKKEEEEIKEEKTTTTSQAASLENPYASAK